MRRWAACLIVSVILVPALTSPGWSQPGCPANGMGCWGGGSTTSNLPQGSCNTGQSSAAYDAARGTVTAQVCCWLGGSGVRVEDDFVVSNLPPNTPLAFRAVLQIWLYCSSRNSFGGSDGNATIIGPDGASRTGSVSASGSQTSSQTNPLDLPIQAVAGQPFHVSYGAGAGVDEGGQAISQGQLVFQDLPAGASIRSCHGFQQDLPVPARHVSWGGVKLLYR